MPLSTVNGVEDKICSPTMKTLTRLFCHLPLWVCPLIVTNYSPIIGYSATDAPLDDLFGDLSCDGADMWAVSPRGWCLTCHSDIGAKHSELCQSVSTAAEERDAAVINRLMVEPWPLKVARLFPVYLATQAHTHTHTQGTLIHNRIQERAHTRSLTHRCLRTNSSETISCVFTGHWRALNICERRVYWSDKKPLLH